MVDFLKEKGDGLFVCFDKVDNLMVLELESIFDVVIYN